MKKKKVVINNLVAKHMLKFNKATVEEDKKEKEKKGYRKHKKNWSKDSSFCLSVSC